jgi:two-component system chemotaxis response regulator CheB
MTRYLDSISEVKVKEVDEKEQIHPGVVYTAPPNYHVLVEEDESFSLSVEDRINFARPSVDVLFESAADVFGASLVGVILTGANNDGSRGLLQVKKKGGLTVVQNPATSEVDGMPGAALDMVKEVDRLLELEEIGPFLAGLAYPKKVRKKKGK